jgi:hypothetical protein
MKKFFATDASGLKADIKRHARSKEDLEKHIADCESRGDQIFADAYRNILVILKHSAAEVNSQIGKKKVDKK